MSKQNLNAFFSLSNTTKCNDGVCTTTITRTTEEDGKSNSSTKSFDFQLSPQSESFQYVSSRCPTCRGCSGCRGCAYGRGNTCPQKCNCWGQSCWGCGNCAMCRRLPKCPRCRVQHAQPNSMFCGRCRRMY